MVAVISFLVTIIKLIFIFCIVATIHEFGHFIIAKWCKTGVNEFSIGFGPKIIQKKWGDTVYSLRWIPLGGYVAIDGEGEESEKENSFAKKNVFQKVAILLAGATFNAILSIVIFVSIAFTYEPYTTTITKFSQDSVLTQAGLQENDKILSIDGDKVTLLSQILNRKAEDRGPISVSYLRDNEKHEVVVPNAVQAVGQIGVQFKIAEDNASVTNQIDLVVSGGAAVKAGMKAGDKIIRINGVETNNSTEVTSIIKANANQELQMEIERNGEKQTITIIPTEKLEFNFGIANAQKVKPNLSLAIDSAVENVKTIIGSYIDLFRGKVGVKDMSGIVGIGEVVSKTSGLLDFLNLMGIISLAIGVANIMPFPPLDGGKIVIVVGEAITRKKLPLKAEEIISYIGFALLFLLTIVVTYNDILRIL